MSKFEPRDLRRTYKNEEAPPKILERHRRRKKRKVVFAGNYETRECYTNGAFCKLVCDKGANCDIRRQLE